MSRTAPKAAPERVLEVKDLRVSYGAIEALKGVSLTLDQGEIVTLIGANGAGKSTTLRSIMGLVPPSDGEILFHGQSTAETPTHRLVRDGLILVPEGRAIFANLSVRENLEMGAYSRRDGKAMAQDFEKVFEIFPRLKEREKQTSGTLSGGEQQMRAIGRALMTNPKLLILDEATEGLSPLLRQEIWSCLARLKGEGQAILVIDKNVGALIKLADRHHIVEKGRVVWTGTSDALARDSELQHRYLGV